MLRLRIPATTANLGPGFDCMGLALDLWNSFEMILGPQGWTYEVHGEGRDILAKDESNLVITTFREELAHLGVDEPKGAHFVNHNAVPCMSGLGSSSTATLAGVLFAHAYSQEQKGQDPTHLDKAKVLDRAIAIEGHGDNVAPALLGGFVIVMPYEGDALTQRVPHVPITAVVCVPEFTFPTSAARKALPDTYSKPDAIFNIGRAMLVAEALRLGDDIMLSKAMDDRIHEPYRLPLIPGAAEAKQAATQAGAICTALSGAGPGIIAFTRHRFDTIGRAMKHAFAQQNQDSRYWILDVSPNGAHVGRMPV